MTDAVPADNVNGPGLLDGRGSKDFYTTITTTDDWVKVDFGFSSGGHTIVCDTKDADWSYSDSGTLDGTTSTKPLHGQIQKGEGLSFDRRFKKFLFVKSTTAGMAADLRIYAW